MAHTPGPWIAEDSCRGKAPDAGCGVIASNEDRRISNPSRGIIAWASRNVGMTSDEAMANANLIAAAPDLLEAARTIMAGFETRAGSLARGVAQLQIAIARAEGRS